MPKHRLEGFIRFAELIASGSAVRATVGEIKGSQTDLEWLVVQGMITAVLTSSDKTSSA